MRQEPSGTCRTVSRHADCYLSVPAILLSMTNPSAVGGINRSQHAIARRSCRCP